jgi:hypothetical protein
MHRRLQKVGDVIGSLPIEPELLRDAFECFQKLGELPKDQRLAAAVTRWARYGFGPTRFDSSPDGEAGLLLATMNSLRTRDDLLMHQLREEAVFGDELVQPIARMALRRLATQGHDVTEPLFLQNRIKLPIRTICCGSVAFALCAFPWRHFPPQYKLITAALVARLERVHETVNANDVWLKDFATATGVFRRTGVLPQDQLLRAAVINDGLFVLLLQAKLGRDKPELIQAFARWHEVEGEERKAVEQGLVEAARAGKLMPLDEQVP